VIGPYIKTTLFPHQRKALTFLLQREHDATSLKRARKYQIKSIAKKLKMEAKSRSASADGKTATSGEGDGTAEPEGSEDGGKGKEKEKEKEDTTSLLWEGRKDEKGRIRIWKNKITGQTLRTKKGEKPQEAKGAILADDVGDDLWTLLMADGSWKDIVRGVTHCCDTLGGYEVGKNLA
jgi:SWI/SNF-related matrix-associated actin-dependent regulator of chromatin subfamily A3